MSGFVFLGCLLVVFIFLLAAKICLRVFACFCVFGVLRPGFQKEPVRLKRLHSGACRLPERAWSISSLACFRVSPEWHFLVFGGCGWNG